MKELIMLLNFISFLLSFFIMSYLYILSLQPMKRSEKYGEKAWNDCKKLRIIGGFFQLVSILNLILWSWFPLPVVNNWIVSSNIWIGIIIGIFILVPCMIIMFLGRKVAGSETRSPSKDTEMFGGIYNYIRHPQTIGEFPIYIALSFILNSWFLIIVSTISITILILIMIYYEERDLIKRFGDEYKEYQERTGAIFPKIFHNKNNHGNV